MWTCTYEYYLRVICLEFFQMGPVNANLDQYTRQDQIARVSRATVTLRHFCQRYTLRALRAGFIMNAIKENEPFSLFLGHF